jgi:hypothetical protein
VARKADYKPDKKPATRKAARTVGADDRGETVSGMEPTTISVSSKHRAVLSDKVLQLTQRATAFRSRLLPAQRKAAVASIGSLGPEPWYRLTTLNPHAPG